MHKLARHLTVDYDDIKCHFLSE